MSLQFGPIQEIGSYCGHDIHQFSMLFVYFQMSLSMWYPDASMFRGEGHEASWKA